jgi:hypothetical protein
MTFSRSDVPEHLTIRITQQSDPVSAVTEDDAWRAVDAYPEVAVVGAVFGFAEPGSGGHWRVVALGRRTPQDARELLGAHLRTMAVDSGDPGERARCSAAARRLELGDTDEVNAGDLRYRVIRAEQFVRTGPEGPEPPRPTDLDPVAPGAGRRVAARTTGLVLDPGAATGLSDGLLRLELLSAGQAPRTHPGGVLLPTEFAVAEEVAGAWQPLTGSSPSPQSARDDLADYIRRVAPAASTDRLDAERPDEIAVLGRHFRVVRVEQLVRVGPDGPEPPRPSDADGDVHG